MAAPAYTEDLTDIALADALTNYLQKNFAGGGGGTLGLGPDFSLHNNNCVDRQVTANDRGIQYDNGVGINVTGTDVHVYQWLFVATGGLTDLLANNGAYVFAGDGASVNVRFHVEGNDTYGAAGRVGKCYPYRYVLTASGAIPYRTLEGTPAGNPRYFGAGINVTGAVKGPNLGVDAVRYGTGAYLTAGELISAGDASDIPATFAGFNAQNDAVANRWGILTKVGTAYELQGKFVIGQNNSKVATACKFKDSAISIVIPDTVHALADFSTIIIDHASSRVELTNFNFEALGTINVGGFVVNAANPPVIIVGGTWTAIGNTILRANGDVDGLTWRNTGTITPNGATVTGAVIASNTNAIGAVKISTPAQMAALSSCDFINNDRAIEITEPGTYTFNGHQFSGNTVMVNYTKGSGTCTINPTNGCNVTQGGTEASVGGTVVVNAVQKTFSFTIAPSITTYEWRVYTVTSIGSLAGAVEIDGEESATVDNQGVAHSYTNQAIAVQIIEPGIYEESITYYTLTAADLDVTINLKIETNS